MLRRHEPFAACPDNFLSACSGLIRVRFVLPEEIIVEEGDFVENALIIEMGSAKVHRQTRPGLRGCPDRTGEVHDSCLDSQIGNWTIGCYTLLNYIKLLQKPQLFPIFIAKCKSEVTWWVESLVHLALLACNSDLRPSKH